MTRAPLLVTATFALALGPALAVAACTNLTSPPTPEPVASETPSAASAPKPAPPPSAPPAPPAPASAAAPPVDAGPAAPLQKKDVALGKGAEAKTGDKVSVLYTGTTTDGKEFDSSKKHGNKPIEFVLGKGQVIPGWDQGLVGMKVGGKRKLTIPPELAYGARGHGPSIPPNSTLLFDVELTAIGAPPAPAPP